MDRTELLESAFDSLTEGIVVADEHRRLALWNRTAEAITGFPGADVVGQRVREMLNLLLVGGTSQWIRQTGAEKTLQHGVLVELRHKVGHRVPVVARMVLLRDGMGGRIGTAVLFHPAKSLDALPHGELGEDSTVAKSQTEMEDRLSAMHEDFLHSDAPLGLLWITVDQARELRRTHGARACEAMLDKMERTLAGGLKPAEEIGRWGDDEFLVLSHERSGPMLEAHAQNLAGLARTTDFRWWGDRVSLTVSIGAAQAECGEPLAGLLERAQASMIESARAGGNHMTAARRR